MRVAVDGGGCSGFKYRYELLEPTAIASDDMRIVDEGGMQVAIDAISFELVRGAVLDYVQELGGAYFAVRNPNAVSKCGCGSSFGV